MCLKINSIIIIMQCEFEMTQSASKSAVCTKTRAKIIKKSNINWTHKSKSNQAHNILKK